METENVFITPERAERLRHVLSLKQPSLTIVLENVHDPHNVSAVLRSCDAVGVVDLFLIYNGRQEFPDLSRKSSAGSKKWIDLHQFSTAEECFVELRKRKYAIYTTNMATDAVSLYTLDLTQRVALVFGNEHSGVSEEALSLADGNFLISQMGMIQSLNISVACAVSLFEALRQRTQAGLYDTPQFSPTEFDVKFQDWQKR